MNNNTKFLWVVWHNLAGKELVMASSQGEAIANSNPATWGEDSIMVVWIARPEDVKLA